MRTSLLVALALLGAAPAWAAEEPSGCDKFKWDIERERAALTAPDRITVASGAGARSAALAGGEISSGGWVDVVQDGHFLKPKAHSGATDCDGIRKTMKYELSASPFVLQVSGTKEDSVSIAVLSTE